MFVYIFWKNRYFTYRSISDTKAPYKAYDIQTKWTISYLSLLLLHEQEETY